MDKKIYIILITIILIISIGILEFKGIERELCFEQANCKKCYTDYVLYPHLYDYYDCNCNSFLPGCMMSPCGLALGITKHNTQVDLLQCLCEDKINNLDEIVEFYNNELSRGQPSEDVDFICTGGARKIYRL